MNGALPPLTQYAFMAWCSVKKKAQGQYYLYLLLEIYANVYKHHAKDFPTVFTVTVLNDSLQVVVFWVVTLSSYLRGCIQKFPDWLPGARTAKATTLCH
jgi:hypothetical protein